MDFFSEWMEENDRFYCNINGENPKQTNIIMLKTKAFLHQVRKLLQIFSIVKIDDADEKQILKVISKNMCSPSDGKNKNLFLSTLITKFKKDNNEQLIYQVCFYFILGFLQKKIKNLNSFVEQEKSLLDYYLMIEKNVTLFHLPLSFKKKLTLFSCLLNYTIGTELSIPIFYAYSGKMETITTKISGREIINNNTLVLFLENPEFRIHVDENENTSLFRRKVGVYTKQYIDVLSSSFIIEMSPCIRNYFVFLQNFCYDLFSSTFYKTNCLNDIILKRMKLGIHIIEDKLKYEFFKLYRLHEITYSFVRQSKEYRIRRNIFCRQQLRKNNSKLVFLRYCYILDQKSCFIDNVHRYPERILRLYFMNENFVGSGNDKNKIYIKQIYKLFRVFPRKTISCGKEKNEEEEHQHQQQQYKFHIEQFNKRNREMFSRGFQNCEYHHVCEEVKNMLDIILKFFYSEKLFLKFLKNKRKISTDGDSHFILLRLGNDVSSSITIKPEELNITFVVNAILQKLKEKSNRKRKRTDTNRTNDFNQDPSESSFRIGEMFNWLCLQNHVKDKIIDIVFQYLCVQLKFNPFTHQGKFKDYLHEKFSKEGYVYEKRKDIEKQRKEKTTVEEIVEQTKEMELYYNLQDIYNDISSQTMKKHFKIEQQKLMMNAFVDGSVYQKYN